MSWPAFHLVADHELEDTQARLAELGPTPPTGRTEAPDIASNRARLARNQQNLDGAPPAAAPAPQPYELGQLADTLNGRLQQNFSTRAAR